MAKREAENQLTQDNWEADDNGGEGGNGEFRKASGDALAGRKIRGMPKRRGAGGAAAAASAAPQPAGEAAQKPSAFASAFDAAPAAASPNPFAALSAPAASSSSSTPSFAFNAPTAKPATNGAAAAPSFGGFGSTSSAFGSSSFSSTPSSSAPAAPAFSFGASSTPSFGTPAAKPAAPAAESSSSGAPQAASLKYYTSLRALNLSLVDALSSELEKDAFVDLAGSGALDRLKRKYEEHRQKVQSEYEAAGGEKAKEKTAGAMDVDKDTRPVASFGQATVPESEIPAIFRNPPKPVPIADLSEEGKDKKAQEEDDGIPAIFKNPPKPVPIADLSETGTGAGASDGIPDIFKNPPKPVPIADLSLPEEKKAAPPAPPAVFSFAGSAVKASSSSAPAAPVSGGFVFKADAPADPYAEKSKFSFAPAAASTAPTAAGGEKKEDRATLKPPSAPKLAPAKLTNPPAKPSPLRFGQSVSPPASPDKEGEKKENAGAKKPAFSFAASFGKVAKGEKEEDKKEEEGKKEEEKKPAFAFGAPSGTFSFGASSSSSTSNAFSPAASTSSATPSKPLFAAPTPFSTPSSVSFGSAKPAAASPPIATSFGAGSPPQFGFGAALQGKEKDKALGTATGAARNTGFGFGSTIGGPAASTGFSFGAQAPEAKKDEPAKVTTGFSFAPSTSSSSSSSSTASAPAPASGFSFAPSAPIPASAASRTASVAPSDASDAPSGTQTPGGNPFAAPGEGEEGETSLYTTRARVWKLAGGESEILGTGTVSFKEKEVDGKTKIRMLARNETNGSVMINFSLHPSFSTATQKSFVTFTGFDADAKPVIYRVRVKDADAVKEFEDKVGEAKARLA
ncbi:hypothetical protein JCM10213_005047 [Rhodosporidiobolus nylandii]